MMKGPYPTNTGERRVVVVGEGPEAIELAFRLRFKLDPKTNILLVPEGVPPRFEPPKGDPPVRRALNRS
jgi:hypothetical protein